MHKTNHKAIATMGFHVAHNLGSAKEFIVFQPDTKTVDLLPLPGEVTGVLIPGYLAEQGIFEVYTGELDAMVLQECTRLGIQVHRGYDGEAQSLVEDLNWQGMQKDSDEDHHHQGHRHGHHHGHGACGCGGACGGASIESVLEAMKGSLKD
ncbi:NifB/NifX family molybdenum-iron cluster-binding protein [Spirochaeta lutea]|uniref:NifB/NifX family molybdenum-iron cluster-binding protein n=1 Tax=Spirochaeta lutea TaxID=1480694 RepID=UPI00055B17FB|nr:hypothetical protein [Spirochaeta lutea]